MTSRHKKERASTGAPAKLVGKSLTLPLETAQKLVNLWWSLPGPADQIIEDLIDREYARLFPE